MKKSQAAQISFSKLIRRIFARKNEEGSFLVETLVAGTILLAIAASAVTQLVSLTNIRTQTEIRDKGIVLVNTLHEQMQNAGCGFDVSVTKDVSASTRSADAKPWTRVGTCAFRAIQNAPQTASNFAKDEDDSIIFANNSLPMIANFCATYGVGGRCELGDQTFRRRVTLNDSGTTVDYDFEVNYWFEKTGASNSTTTCSTIGSPASGISMPDVIVRKVVISWENSSLPSGRESMTVVKRQNVPADSLDFSSSTRVGVYSSGNQNTVMILPVLNASGAQLSIFQVTRNNAANGGSSCVWFPYLEKTAQVKPSFKEGSASVVSPSYGSINSLQSGPIS